MHGAGAARVRSQFHAFPDPRDCEWNTNTKRHSLQICAAVARFGLTWNRSGSAGPLLSRRVHPRRLCRAAWVSSGEPWAALQGRLGFVGWTRGGSAGPLGFRRVGPRRPRSPELKPTGPPVRNADRTSPALARSSGRRPRSLRGRHGDPRADPGLGLRAPAGRDLALDQGLEGSGTDHGRSEPRGAPSLARGAPARPRSGGTGGGRARYDRGARPDLGAHSSRARASVPRSPRACAHRGDGPRVPSCSGLRTLPNRPPRGRAAQ